MKSAIEKIQEIKQEIDRLEAMILDLRKCKFTVGLLEYNIEKYFSIEPLALQSKRRDEHLVDARFILAREAYERGNGPTKIAEQLRRDHSTAVFYLREFKNRRMGMVGFGEKAEKCHKYLLEQEALYFKEVQPIKIDQKKKYEFA